MGLFEAIRYAFRPVPKSGQGNASAYAYLRTQAPPVVWVGGTGRIVMRSMAPIEGAFILEGFGTPVNAAVASSLGINSTPGMTGLTPQKNSFILGD